MTNKNICKFSTPLITNSLYISQFIFETEAETMKKPVNLNENRMYLISKGNGKMAINKEEVSFQVGDLIFGFKGEKVTVIEINNCEFMYIDFDGTRATELFRRFAIIDSNRKFQSFDGLIPFWKESLSRASKENIDLSAESILLYSFSRFSALTKKGNPLVNKIIELSEENFKSNEFSINSIAEELGYNSKYISHIFKEKTGVTYSEYLRDLRIKYAVSLFDHGLDSVKNVAVLSGFSDPLYFSTVFKKCIGVTPKEYKIRERGE
ncbi:MAG: helix-turn-helix transcriptional regulator [Ruminococcaceae bacterium]|nr:helix-turn-helix transcriptional regulator [Oscillospiraceae bacterium]